jgi:hypothetical protein
MRCRIDIDLAIATLRTALDPYECVVRVYHHDRRLGFRFLDHQGKLLHHAAGIRIRNIVHLAWLRAAIQGARDRLERKAPV